MVKVEIEKIENGYILEKTDGWTHQTKSVYNKFEALCEALQYLFGETAGEK